MSLKKSAKPKDQAPVYKMIHRKGVYVISFICLFATLSVLSLLSLKDSFRTAFSGDDWLMLYTIWMDSDVRRSVSYWDISTYLSTYGPPYGFMSIIRHFYSYEPLPYYIVSFFSRVLASVSIFYLIKNITKKIAPALMASFIFAVTYIGIQTTDWVFNFNHYFGISILCLFLIFYFKTKESQTLMRLIMTASLFALSLLVSPNRMHGIFPLIVVIETAWLLIETRKYSFKKAFIRIISFLVTYKMVFSGAGYGTAEYNLSLVKKGFDLGSDLFSKGQTWFLLNPLSTLGNYIVPDRLYKFLPFNEISEFIGRPGSTFTHTLAITTSVGLVGLILFKLIDPKSKAVIPFGGTLIFWTLFMRWIKRLNPVEYSIYNADFATIGGGILILSVFIFFLLKRKEPRLAHILLVSTGWMVAFTVFTWILAPYSILDTGLRYSLQQGVGSAIWFSVIFYLLLKYLIAKRGLRYFIIPVLIFIFLFFKMNINFANDYFRELNLHRGIQLDKKLWSEITTKVPDIPDDRSSIFYLIYDDYLTAEIGLRSGFSARAAMHYNIRNQNNNPYMIFNYTDLLSIVTNGQAWTNQGEPVDVTPTDYVFAFELKDNNISDKTSETRKELQKEILKYNENFNK